MGEEIPKEHYEQMRRVCDPMMKALAKMSGAEIAQAMKGFQATSHTNCPWYAYGLRHAILPVLATAGSPKPGYAEERTAQAEGHAPNPEPDHD